MATDNKISSEGSASNNSGNWVKKIYSNITGEKKPPIKRAYDQKPKELIQDGKELPPVPETPHPKNHERGEKEASTVSLATLHRYVFALYPAPSLLTEEKFKIDDQKFEFMVNLASAKLYNSSFQNFIIQLKNQKFSQRDIVRIAEQTAAHIAASQAILLADTDEAMGKILIEFAKLYNRS